MRSIFKESVKEHSVQKQITRFTVDVFEAAVKLLSYKLSFEIVPFYGDYDDLLKKVALKTFDAAIGDIVIRAEGYQLVEFSQSYVDTGLMMVVTTKSEISTLVVHEPLHSRDVVYHGCHEFAHWFSCLAY
ncbi:hypothetical protein GH714_032223 [Hevea brasiliensis]|uniref:Solute-binding protein family 3/N-terminal domain-containing protein n=1 Tax=Hevea brasiliensis TaxID=3981 RepID=A0A6A6L6F2_HEVBR|nr:hypothetical protein GH714_032223 [Hevea brasiliensis]